KDGQRAGHVTGVQTCALPISVGAEARPVGPSRSDDRVRRASQDRPLNREGRIGLSEQRKCRSWTAKPKLEIVLAGLKGDRSVRRSEERRGGKEWRTWWVACG